VLWFFSLHITTKSTIRIKTKHSQVMKANKNEMREDKKVKVKFSRYRPSVAQRVGRGIALLFHDRGTRRG